MERTMFLWLAVSSIALSANTQNVPNSSILNPDHIYFDDNRPNAGKPGNRQMESPNVNLQPPYKDQLPSVTNVIETTNNWNPLQKPVDFNLAEQPIYPSVIPSQFPVRHSVVMPQRNNDSPTIQLDQTAAALTNFSINIIKNILVRNQGNVVVSPYSIATLLALLQQGASQQSLQQISIALQMSAQTSAAVYKSHTQDISTRQSRNILKTANNIFVADAFSLNPLFSIVAQTDFGSEVTSTTFERPEQSARQINSWVASKTNNKIDKLISPDALDVSTQMVLVNAIYFKGLWAEPFNPKSSKIDAFTLRTGAVKNVPFMMIRRNFRAGVDPQTDAQVVVLPFERDEYSLMVILPSTLSNAQNTLFSLTVPQLESYLNFKPMEVAVQIPKFTIKADTDLTPVLKQMGVTQIFDQSSGLQGLGMYRTFTPQVSSAVHSALLSIDEEGSVAAAASAFSVVALSNDEPSMSVKVNRPFVAVLWDEKTKVPLFMVKIEDPNL